MHGLHSQTKVVGPPAVGSTLGAYTNCWTLNAGAGIIARRTPVAIMENSKSPINGQAVRGRYDHTLWTIVLGHSFVAHVGEDSHGTKTWPDPEPEDCPETS
jgi:hypothetical protein